MEITGRLTGDAVVRSLSEDRKVVNFSVAVNDSYKTKNGERVTQTEFFDCSYWLGTGIAPYLTKGKIVELSGRVSVRAWIDGGGQAKAGLNFHTAKITLHGGGQAVANEGTGKPQEAKAAAMEVNAEVVQGKEEEHDDLPF
ncbi:single-stranded DNA-binding protein [Flavobacterium sp. J372]|uniref:single-stranded DNA-binding protein n=1 Tax=Flavobacterium sp. J372 TaxID=2898436 RepID=UPI002150D8AE|nr:single-stranded DNA-binding protein [Flavobacterium sp. J372]MCR5862565.1 single-stranded DNA-binding protein [Flavobacterium sp. J372]